MPSRSARQVVAYAPDGTEVIYETAAKWDTAGLVKSAKGEWYLAAHGFSTGSVRQRTITHYHRNADLTEYSVGSLWEATAPLVRQYFGSHRVIIDQTFTPAKGWVKVGRHKAGRADIRRLAREGVTAVSIRCAGNDRMADFQMDELLRDMKTRRSA